MAVGKRGGKSENRLRKAWSTTLPDHCIGLAWSPDESKIAAAAVSGPIVLLESRTGSAAHTLPGHGFGTTAIAWQPGGTLLASSGQDGMLRLWDTATGTEKHAMAGGSAWVEHLAWAPDGQTLATAAGKKVRVWNTAGTMLAEFADHASTVADLAWRPGTGELTIASYGGVILRRLDAPDSPRKLEWKGSPLKMAWSPDGQVLAHGNQDATVHFWYADTGTPLQMSGYPSKVRELAWDYLGRLLATGGGPAVYLWDCGGKGPEGTAPQSFDHPGGTVSAVAWQNRGFLLASGDRTGRVNLWQPANKKGPHVGEDRATGQDEVSTMAWAPGDRNLAVGYGSGAVVMFQIV